MEKFFDFIKKHGDLFTFLGLLIVCYFIFFFNIGNYPLMDVDETRYVSMARDMFHCKDFLTLYLNGIFHHHYSIIVLIADCTALYLPSFECAAKQVIKYAFPSFSYRTTML